MDDKYYEMVKLGHAPQEVYSEMKKDGLKFISSIALLIKLFNLSVIEAKSIMIKADTGDDLNTHQQKIGEALKQFIDEEGLA